MSLKQTVYSVLIVSASDTFTSSLVSSLPESRFQPVHKVRDCGSAGRSLAEREYDLILINSPLPDGNGQTLAIDICSSRSCVVLMMIRSELHEQIRDKVSSYGVFTLPKPVTRPMFQTALDWMAAARERLRKNEARTQSIQEKMEEIRLVNRAKWLLIHELGMDEPEAHRYIVKQAMDRSLTKPEIARQIINTYS